MDKLVDDFEKSLFNSSKDVISDYLEIGIDSLMNEGILKEIPIVNTIVGVLKIGKNVHDNGFGMFRLFIKYKLEEQGKQFIKIDKWFPSSKMCHCCGSIKEDLKLSDRWYICDCGYENDRDYNAAMNIKDCGTRLLAW